MSCYDRVAIGGELLLFDHPDARPPGVKAEGEGGVEGEEASPVPPPTAEFAVEELQAALRNKGKQAQEVRCFSMAGLQFRFVLGLRRVWECWCSPVRGEGVGIDGWEPTNHPRLACFWSARLVGGEACYWCLPFGVAAVRCCSLGVDCLRRCSAPPRAMKISLGCIVGGPKRLVRSKLH